MQEQIIKLKQERESSMKQALNLMKERKAPSRTPLFILYEEKGRELELKE